MYIGLRVSVHHKVRSIMSRVHGVYRITCKRIACSVQHYVQGVWCI